MTCQFPESWRLGTVVPIYKQAGDPSIASNFRPITLLSHLSKIVEKVVFNQLATYISERNILYERQYAYRHCYSTENAVLDAVDWICQNIDSGYVSTIITADLSKAFDSIDHGVLLCKLGWYGIDPSWFATPATWAVAVRWSAAVAPLPLLSPTASHRGRLSGRSCSAFSAMICRVIWTSSPSFMQTTLTCWTGRSLNLSI